MYAMGGLRLLRGTGCAPPSHKVNSFEMVSDAAAASVQVCLRMLGIQPDYNLLPSRFPSGWAVLAAGFTTAPPGMV